MADATGSGVQERKGLEPLKKHLAAHKLELILGFTRLVSILFTFLYFIRIFGSAPNNYYKVLLANAATSAIRLHQRLPTPSFTKEFLLQLISEDSFHYLFYSVIFIYVSPLSLVLLPIFCFSVIHFSSYALNLLDILGQNKLWVFRLWISLVEFQSRNILRLIALTEILLMPLVVIVLFFGRGNMLTPLVYYHFLTLRYASRRNPHTRIMFHELRVQAETLAAYQSVPNFLRNMLLSGVNAISKLAPQVPTPAEAAR